jgi:hypothetical protein
MAQLYVMQEGKKKAKVRLTRNSDGSIGAPKDVTAKDDIVELWGKQSASFALPKLSLKEEFSSLKKSFSSKKKIAKQKKTNTDKTHASTEGSNHTNPVVITLSIPALRIPKRILPHTRRQVVLNLAVVLAATGIIGYLLVHDASSDNNSGEVQGSVTSSIPTNVTPDFPVLTPLGTGVDDLGGFAKISPKDAPAVYAYRDTISGIPIKVSQQQLPDTLRTDQANKVRELAEGFNAKNPLEVGDNTAYIGASTNGVQSVVYVKGENLVLIASDNTISNSDWVTYIGNLRY